MTTVLAITQGQQACLQAFVKAYDYKGGWAYLASIGDSYADDAAKVVSAQNYGDKGYLIHLLVESHWKNTAGQQAYEAKFDAVALRHFEQYAKIVEEQNGKLPDTKQIEESYRTAVEWYGLPANTAFDGVFTQSIGKLAGKAFDWPDMLGIEAARQVPSDVFSYLDSGESAKLVGLAAIQARALLRCWIAVCRDGYPAAA